MLKLLIFVLLLASGEAFSYPSGSGTCVVDADYASITGMTGRRRNLTNGPYSVTTNTNYYSQGTPVEITISGPNFIGIMFTVVNENGQNVGTFAPEQNVIHDCAGNNSTTPTSAAVTHLSGFSMTSYTLFWNPPANNEGEVYILGYVLKGPTSQEFFRFVRDDGSAVSLNAVVAPIPSLNSYSIFIIAVLLLLIGYFTVRKRTS